MNLSPVDRVLFRAWSRAQGLSHAQQERALSWMREIAPHYLRRGDVAGLERRAIEDAKAAGLRAGAVEDAISLSQFGPQVVAAAESGKGPALLPAFAGMMSEQDDPPEADETTEENDTVEADRAWYREIMETSPNDYHNTKMANGKTPAENYLELLQREEGETQGAQPAQPAAGKYANQGTLAIAHKPEFVLPDGMTEAPGFRSFARIGQGQPLVIDQTKGRQP